MTHSALYETLNGLMTRGGKPFEIAFAADLIDPHIQYAKYHVAVRLENANDIQGAVVLFAHRWSDLDAAMALARINNMFWFKYRFAVSEDNQNPHWWRFMGSNR